MVHDSPAPSGTRSSPRPGGSKLAPWKSERWRSASRKCEHCETVFRPWSKLLPTGDLRVMKEHDWRKQRFCSISCSKRHENAMMSPVTREKVSQTMRRLGHQPRLRGGNGRPMPAVQQAMLSLLGTQWVAEHAIPTRMPRTKGWPTCFKIDLANPTRMIAIELDGHSHETPSRREQDRRKTAFLAASGWSVVRVTNERALKLCTTCTSADTLLTSLMGRSFTTVI